MIAALLIILIVLIIVGFVFVIFHQNKSKPDQHELLNALLEKNEEQRSKHKGEMDSSVRDMLNSNQKQIDLIVSQLRDQLRDSQQDTKSLKEQNAALREHLNQSLKVTKELQTSTEGLRNLLSNNRLRGDWGEQVAEDLLLAAGFVENVNYVKQASTEQSRPDFTILLPDGVKLNIDAKFPFDDLVAYQEASSELEKQAALKNFRNAIRNKVKEVTTRDYINPEQNTVDFVVMFIPNEMIFSFIYEKIPDITEYCNQKKVVLTGPFGFTALVRLVLQAHKNFQYEKGLAQILGLIEKFRNEYEKFGSSIEKLGNQIETTRKTFSEIEVTRSKQLTRVVDKISDYSVREAVEGSQTIPIEPSGTIAEKNPLLDND